MTTRELRRKCERFTSKLIAEGANPAELVGLLLGAMMRDMRDRGVPREKYIEACSLLWNNNNPADLPIEDEKVGSS